MEKYGQLLREGRWDGNRAIFSDFERIVDDLLLDAIKIGIIGFGGTGKQEVLRFILGKDVNLEYIPTINADMTRFNGEDLGIHRSLVFWDFAGQSQFKSLWPSLLQGTDITLLITDSTFENINSSKEIIHKILDKSIPDKLVIGIANKQNLPNRLSPEFCERILSTEKRRIKTYGLDTNNPADRDKILAVLKDAILSIIKIDESKVQSGESEKTPIERKEEKKLKLPQRSDIKRSKKEKRRNYLTTTKEKRKKEETKDGDFLITYTRHLEKRLRNLETEKQLLNAERLRLEQELHSLRNEIDRLRERKQESAKKN